MKVTSTRKFEFDAAHRLPAHAGKCAGVHGHRYVVEVEFSGNQNVGNDSEANVEVFRQMMGKRGVDDSTGMIVDFGDIKRVIGTWIDDTLDHALIISGYKSPDTALNEAIAGSPVAKVVHCPVGHPTSENMAMWFVCAFQSLIDGAGFKGVKVQRVRVYETPNCWSEARA